jgi:hypothetical protein
VRVVVCLFASGVIMRMLVLRSIGMHMLVFVDVVFVMVFGVGVPVRVRVFASVGMGMLVGVL